QLVLLGYQVRNQQDVRLIRVWAVTAVTPAARVLEWARSGVTGLLDHYLLLIRVREENEYLRQELGDLKLEAQHLRAELAMADRAKAMAAFEQRNPFRTVAARIIGAGTGADSKVVFIDRGTASGVLRGMAVVTPDGVVGRVRASYPTASQIVLITDSSFAAGVISQTNHVQGTLKGTGAGLCAVDYVRADETLEEGEWFYTSGDDRVFPRGLPVGQVIEFTNGATLKEVSVAPSGLRNGLEAVLVILEGMHQPVPDATVAAGEQPMLSPPVQPGDAANSQTDPAATLRTDADQLLERYSEIGEAQGHVFGEGIPGSRPPEFNQPPESSLPASPLPAGSPGAPQP
ncbi:MAG: rod shape-determining protein MreC, partial [bacterium]|nr:rod shape-determining protein MreC [bacterium]